METRSYSRYVLVALCIAVVFTSLILVALNAWIKQPGGPELSDSTDVGFATKNEELREAFREGYQAAQQRLRASGQLIAPIETKILVGTVTTVNADGLVVQQTNLDTHPDVDDVPDERTIVFSPNVKVYKETRKTDEQLEIELREHSLRDDPFVPPPTPTARTISKISDIPAGATVFVRSLEDVRLLASITAEEIVWIVSASN